MAGHNALQNGQFFKFTCVPTKIESITDFLLETLGGIEEVKACLEFI